MTDTHNIPDTKDSWASTKLMTLVGALLLMVGFFLPWMSNPELTASGQHIAQNAYGHLYVLPVIALLSGLLAVKGHKRVFNYMALGLTSLLIYILFFSQLQNYTDGNLYLHVQAGQDTAFLYKVGEESFRFIPAESIGLGKWIGLLGAIILFLSPTPKYLMEVRPVLKATKGRERPKHPSTLEELKPGGDFTYKYKAGFITLICGGLLIYTYVWCGISPLKAWENHGNAIEYIFGREMNETDLAYMERQSERAPEVATKGKVREFMDNKYRGVPFDEQPSLMEKMKEEDIMYDKFWAEMTEEEKQDLRERAYEHAQDEKKGGYFPPVTNKEKLKGYMIALLETIAMAIWGTLLAVVCSVPAALLAAENTLKLIISGESAAAKSARSSITFAVRRFLDACRGFNELVMALIFVAVLGLGPFAGILALWIHTFGIIGKVFSEQIEAAEKGPIEGLSSTGATVSQIIAFSVMPQVMSGFVSYSLLRFESNVRSAAILGFVGAGGIGFLIYDKMNGYLFREVCTIMIIIIITVGIIDYGCKLLRKKFI